MYEEITSIAIEDYLSALMPPRPEVFAELEEQAQKRGLPIIGPVQGQLLQILARSVNAREVLEVGTVTGYAAMWLLSAVAPVGGRVTALEREPERSSFALEQITRAGYGESVEIRQGDWFHELQSLSGPYDLIFLDILRNVSTEHEAVRALELCVERLRPGGLLVADNTLCNGLVLEEDPAPIVRGIQQFNTTIMQHPQLESVVLPLRDGVAICRKKD